MEHGVLSIAPALLAVILAFITRDAIFSLLIACVAGVFILGGGIFGLTTIFEEALGNAGFIWVVQIEVFIGILVAFFFLTGATEDFTKFMDKKIRGRAKVQLMAWLLGLFIFFSDYFSPLFVGPVMRGMTDKAKISREKLAYICDSTSAPKAVLVPIGAWPIFIAALLVGYGPIKDIPMAMNIYIRTIPFNLYAIFAIVLVGLIASGIVPDFGPMKKAEKRAMEEGKVLADNAVPLMGKELSGIKRAKVLKPRLIINFFIPVILIMAVAIGTYIVLGSTKLVTAFMAADFYLLIVLLIQGVKLKDIVATAVQGIKGVLPAILILALAYTINTITQNLGAAAYVVSVTEGWLNAHYLPIIIFGISAFISFATGTAWGTYAILIPIAIPMAFTYSGGELSMLVYATIAAVASGGVFGDHCSPLSDTTILSSLGASSDHIDHVKTQIPYSFLCAFVALICYLVIGFIF